MRKSITLIILWLVIVNVFGVITLNRLNLQGDNAYTWISQEQTEQPTWNPVPMHARWDSVWLISVAREGYHLTGPSSSLSNVVFFPLYPLLLKIAGYITAQNIVLAGWILSSIFLAGFAVVFTRLVRTLRPDIDPMVPLTLVLVFPTAFFLNAVYTESLFLFLSVSSFLCMHRKRWWLAGAFGLLAALTRITGALLFIPLAWEYWEEYRTRGFRKEALAALLPPLGTAAFFSYHWIRFGDPLLFFKTQASWGRSFLFNSGHFTLFSPASVVNLGTDIVFLAVGIAGAILAFKRLRTSYALYALAMVLVPVMTGTLMSIGRYVLVSFPIFIVFATIRSEIARKTWIFASVLLLALYITLFAHGYWAG